MTPKKWWHFLILFVLVSGLSVSALAALAITLIYPTLPSLEMLTNYQPKQPLRVYSADKLLIGEFGEERRAFIKISDVPKNLKDAVLAIEDRRFYQHGGIDFTGVMRAIKNNVTGKSREGASTITMQVAKNFFTLPGKKRTLVTKIKEALLAIKIEKALNKDQIFEIYLNQIFLGQRAYGFAAASQVYYGKPLGELTLAESALLAGLPKAPTNYNPYLHPDNATSRQHEVLRDMFRFGFIDEAKYDAALKQKLKFKTALQVASSELSADYVAEVVRQILFERYQDAIYSSGLKVYTTIKKPNQEAANNAILQGVLEYQRRQGYQKPEKVIDLTQLKSTNLALGLQRALDEMEVFHGLMPAIVIEASAKKVSVFAKNGEEIELAGTGLSAVQYNLSTKAPKERKIVPGSVLRLIKSKGQWIIVQLPEVEAALIALDPETGAVTALVGGFDFKKNKFNHVTQAWRQPGSSFKPFVYSAALEKGFTASSIIQDAPLTLSAAEVGSTESWSPKNFDEHYSGPMRLRSALTKSKNMVSIRVIKKIGPTYAQDYITKFGFSAKQNPAYLSMALGSNQVTAWGMANGYAVFANGGYRITPHIISKITDSNNKVLEEMHYPKAKQDAPRVIDGRNAFIMTSIMKDVVQKGTAVKAKKIGRQDLAGKTGTTNDNLDAWFAGFMPKQVAVAWIGFDQPKSLGKDETGGKAALPIWIHYMDSALKGLPDVPYKVPQGVSHIKVSAYTGGRIDEYEEGIYEYFYHESPPKAYVYVEPLPPLIDPNEPSYYEHNMIDNPLQPAPPPLLPPPPLQPAPPQAAPPPAPVEIKNEPSKAPETVSPANAAARMLNPSGH